MMYNEKLAVAVKSAGKVLREFKDTIYIPFGSEYSILIKNLNSVRALVKVSIDNTDVCEDGLVIDANSSLELERFVKDLTKGNRFKFIERTGAIENHRGIKVEDGLIRVEFQFEKVVQTVVTKVVHETHHVYKDYYHDWQYWYRPDYPPYIRYASISSSDCGGYGAGSAVGSSGVVCNNLVNTASVGSSGSAGGMAGATNTDAPASAYLCSNSAGIGGVVATPTMDNMLNEAGITVAGSVSDQLFKLVSSFPVEDAKHVIVLKLLGETDKGKKVAAPVTVKSKQKCTTCGHLNKATAKFCTECGTALEIV